MDKQLIAFIANLFLYAVIAACILKISKSGGS